MEITADNLPRALNWGNLTGPEAIASRLCVLLRLERGEVAYDRMRGLDPEIAGRAVVGNGADVRREVDRQMKWEPWADLKDVKATNTQEGGLRITLVAEVGN